MEVTGDHGITEPEKTGTTLSVLVEKEVASSRSSQQIRNRRVLVSTVFVSANDSVPPTCRFSFTANYNRN